MRILIFLVLLTSCDEKTAGPSPAPPADFALRLGLDPKNDPNHYDVLITWEPPQGVTEYSLEREVRSLSPLSSPRTYPDRTERLSGSLRTHLDKAVPVGKEVTYFLFASLDSGETLRANAQLTIPTDRVFQTQEALKSFSHSGRVFLLPEARLQTLGEEVEIAVTELVARGGKIEMFPANAPAVRGAHGRAAGSLTIFAERASGDLEIFLSGENGGAGSAGRKGYQGEKGKRGNDGEIELLINPPPGFNGDLHRKHVKELETNEPRIHASWAKIYRCKSVPQDGTEGGAGGPGERGLAGGRGGDSGKLNLQVNMAPNFRVHPVVAPGKGGDGGEGGMGGDGGPGGEPGSRDRHEICAEAKKGKTGAIGLKGEKGESGVPGNALPYCLRIQGTEFGNCALFSTRQRAE